VNVLEYRATRKAMEERNPGIIKGEDRADI
jgi:hypothetical protein